MLSHCPMLRDAQMAIQTTGNQVAALTGARLPRRSMMKPAATNATNTRSATSELIASS
jgi:hypothetical protein